MAAPSPATKSDGSGTTAGSVDASGKAWGDTNRLQDLEELQRQQLKKGPPPRTTRLIPLTPTGPTSSSPRRRGRGARASPGGRRAGRPKGDGQKYTLPIEAYPNGNANFKLNPTAAQFSPGGTQMDPSQIPLSPFAKPFAPRPDMGSQDVPLSPMAKPFTPIKDMALSPHAKAFVPNAPNEMPDMVLGGANLSAMAPTRSLSQTKKAKIQGAGADFLEDFGTL